MPDISMCDDSDCPVNKSCYRFTAIPSEYQTYFMDSPRLDERESESKGLVEGSCSYYWAIIPKSKLEEDEMENTV